MSNLHKIIADSLSDSEYSVLEKIQTPHDGRMEINARLMTVLRDLRLIEMDGESGSPRISALGNLVYYQKFTRDLKSA